MFKFNRIALFSIVAGLAISSVAMANGPYVGAGVGYQLLDRNLQLNVLNTTSLNNLATNTPLLALSERVNLNLDQWGQGALGQLYLGYGYCLTPSWWTALEVNVDYTGTRARNFAIASAGFSGAIFGRVALNFANIGTVNVATQQNLKWDWGPTFRLGYFVTNSTKLYGIVGAEDGSFNTSYTLTAVNGAGIAPGGIFANQLLGTLTNNKSVWGIRYGAGLEVNLTNELGVRGEVTQTRYRSWTINPGSTVTSPNFRLNVEGPLLNISNTVATSFKEKPVTTEAVLSVVWTLPDFLGAPVVAG